MDTKLLTYKELAELWGCKLDSARKTVRRRGWARVTGNDGQVRIHVPVEAANPSNSPSDSPEVSLPGSPSVLESQIQGLKDLVESERRRADAAESDRDAWRAMAEKSVWKRLFG